jgi:hypothetical protein
MALHESWQEMRAIQMRAIHTLFFFRGEGVGGGVGDVHGVLVSGYTVTRTLPTLAALDASMQADARQAEAPSTGENDKKQASAVEGAAPHTTAVLTVPALVMAAAYAAAVWRGLATFPPPARSLYSFAELLPV